LQYTHKAQWAPEHWKKEETEPINARGWWDRNGTLVFLLSEMGATLSLAERGGWIREKSQGMILGERVTASLK